MPYTFDKSDCSKHSIFKGVDIFTLAGQGLMLSVVEMQPGAVVELHSHPHEQMGLMLEGELEFTIGDEVSRVVTGMMWSIPGNVPHRAVAGPQGCRALDVFNPVRDDYR